MDIRWHGGACFELRGERTTVVTDPPVGGAPAGDVVLRTRRTAVAPTAGGAPFVVDGPGEYEVRGVFVVGVPGAEDGEARRSLYAVTVDEVRVAHVGTLAEAPSEVAIEGLGGIDVLLLPIGGDGPTAAAAAELVGQLEPAIVTPVAAPGDPALELFLREMGAAEAEAVDGFRALPHRIPEDTQVVPLLRHGSA